MSERPRWPARTAVVPAEKGNGLAMRAGLFLEALAADHEVTLLAVPVSGAALDAWPAFVRARTGRRVWLDLEAARIQSTRRRPPTGQVAALRAYPRPALARFATAATVEDARQEGLAGRRFNVVVVLRLYLAPFVDAAPGRPGGAGPGR